MYSLVRAYGVKNSPNSLWQDQDISNLKMFELFQMFRQLYLELSNPLLTDNVYVNISDIEEQYFAFDDTLDVLFASNPTLSLPTVASIPSYTQKYARYMDAFRAGYKVDITVPGQKPGSSQEDATELAIRRDGTSNKDIHDFCLVTVNGFLYQTDYDDNYLYVLDGGKSLKLSRKNTCGLTSFEDIGKVSTKQITKDNISAMDATTALAHKALITVPDEFVGKALMLSIGGYLVIPSPNAFRAISDNLWILNTEQLDIVGRYFESKNYVDLSSLNLTVFPKDPNKVSLIELISDDVMVSYLTHPQSFFISVDTDTLVYIKHFIRHSALAGIYTAYSNPTQPMFLGRGRQADYWKQPDENQWVITVENGFRPNLLHDTIDKESIPNDSGANPPYDIYSNSRAFLLDFIADIKTS